jgi:glycosyltransferase involved in cell wall biosynthesis
MTEGTDAPLRVTQIGNSSRGPGGVGSVVRVINSWADSGLEVREWPTYWHGSRYRTLLSLVRTVPRVVFASAGPRDVWHFHMTQRGSFVREGSLLWIARRRRICCTVSIHGSDFVGFARGHRWLVGPVLRGASAVFVLTDAARDVLQSMGLCAMTVVNAVPVDTEPHGGGRSGFVFVGEVGRRKGVDTLLCAWQMAQVKGHRLLLLGSLERGFELPRQLPDGVVVLGPVEPHEVLSRLRSSVALVLPSRAEAMPMSILESMSVGTPVIATGVGQVQELVGDGGLVVPPADPAALSAAIRRMVDLPGLAPRLGLVARQLVEARYSTMAVKASFLAEWVRCLGAGGPPPRPDRSAVLEVAPGGTELSD